MPCFISSGGHALKFKDFPCRFGTSPECEILLPTGLGIAEHQFTVQREGSRIVLIAQDGDHVTKVNGGIVKRTYISEGDIIDAGDLQLTYSDPAAPAFDANLPTMGPKSSEWGKNASEVPFDLEPIPGMDLAHTPKPVGQQPQFTPSDLSQPIHSTHVHLPQEQEQEQEQEQQQIVQQPVPRQQAAQPPAQAPQLPQATQPTPMKPPSQTSEEEQEVLETVDFDWAAAIEEPEPTPDGDLAAVFWQEPEDDALKAPNLAVPPVIEDLELPSIPDIAEAEESGTAVTSKETHSKTINPIASKTMRRPNVPRAKRDVSTLSPIDTQALEQETEPGKGTKRRRRGWRKKKTLEERMLDAKGQPKCKRLIPWHKVAVLVVIFFGAAGAWLATEGQDIVADIMHRFGLQTEADHKPYLERFVTTDPVLLLTMDADAWISFYRECATALGTMTVSELNQHLASTTTAFNVDDIDRLTLAVDRKGQMLALISVKEAINRRRLIYNLDRGMASSEKLPNNITLHSGYIGRSAPVQFALLNEKTLAIGEATALKEFLTEDDAALALVGQNKQLLELARSSTDSLGLYVKPAALLAIRSKAPTKMRPFVDRISENIVFPADFELIAQINSDVSFAGSGSFETATEASAFTTDLPTLIDEQFKRIASYLGSETATIDGMRAEFDNLKTHASANNVQFAIKVPNRWYDTELQHLQETVQRVAHEMKSSKAGKADYTQQRDLLSPEDARFRDLAKNVANKHGIAMSNNAPKLKDEIDIKTIVKRLAGGGVRGGGVYKALIFKVKGINDQATVNQVAKLLTWQDGQLVFSPYKAKDPLNVASADDENEG